MKEFTKNVLGTQLKSCCTKPMTGFYRDGFCSSGEEDQGSHTVCILATNEFLNFSKYLGNDLSTPIPQYNFPGVAEGNKWCLCAARWLQAYENECAPLVDLEATNEKALQIIPLDLLLKFDSRKKGS